MKNDARMLDLQAHVDGELEPSARQRIEAWIAADAQAAALARELGATRRLLREQEPPHRLPVDGDFYWSQIRRQIEQAQRRAAQSPAPAPWYAGAWLRWLAPAAALAVLALAVYWNPAPFGSRDGEEVALETLTEVPYPEMSAMNFRSESAKMTVVWLNYASLR